MNNTDEQDLFAKKDASFGHFGYETLPGGLIIPYIFRSGEKFYSKEIVQWHLLQPNIIDRNTNNLNNFHYLKSRERAAKACEINLLNEINNFHNGGMYPKKFSISQEVMLLSHDDVFEICTFQKECVLAKQSNHLNSGGYIRLTSKETSNIEFILPYMMVEDQFLVPISLLNKVFGGVSWKKNYLSGIDIQYIQFLCNQLQAKIDTSHKRIECATVEQFTNRCSKFNLQYWPALSECLVNFVSRLPTPPTKRKHDHSDHDYAVSPDDAPTPKKKITTTTFKRSSGKNPMVEESTKPVKDKHLHENSNNSTSKSNVKASKTNVKNQTKQPKINFVKNDPAGQQVKGVGDPNGNVKPKKQKSQPLVGLRR